jgi:acetyl-CoA carboxylase biotin carboxylase subunit
LLLSPSGPGIRRDSGIYEGWTVPMDYDPLLDKLIGYGSDRQEATARLLDDPDFRAGNLDTGYLDRLLRSRPPAPDQPDPNVAAIAAGVFALLDPTPDTHSADAGPSTASLWKKTTRTEALS